MTVSDCTPLSVRSNPKQVRLMWIKICGITNSGDAATVVRAGANAIGLNFCPDSRRYVPLEQARCISKQVSDDVEVVGVFVNEPPHHVAMRAQEAGLTAVQFHGDESKSDIQEFQSRCPEIPVIRCFRIGSETTTFETQWQEFDDLPTPLTAALADAWSPDQYGGTGRTVNTDLLDGHQQLVSRLILAGGLTPNNVAHAISMIRPWGVDTASGVESSPGVKSADLVERFVMACRAVLPNSLLINPTLKQDCGS